MDEKTDFNRLANELTQTQSQNAATKRPYHPSDCFKKICLLNHFDMYYNSHCSIAITAFRNDPTFSFNAPVNLLRTAQSRYKLSNAVLFAALANA